MDQPSRSIGRRERAKEEKRARLLRAARELFAEYGVGRATTQQIADRADVAVGTLFRYAATKAELLIMAQNQKFAGAIDAGLAAVRARISALPPEDDAVSLIVTLLEPVVICIREHPENGRTYLQELVFGDPAEPNRREGLELTNRLEDGIALILERAATADAPTARVLARVVTAIVHISATATTFVHRDSDSVLADIRDQVAAILPERGILDRCPGRAKPSVRRNPGVTPRIIAETQSVHAGPVGPCFGKERS